MIALKLFDLSAKQSSIVQFAHTYNAYANADFPHTTYIN